MSLDFNTLKALHIIFMVAWFSGTFYLVRLFIYNKEAEKKDEPEKIILQRQYAIMLRRLWYIITWPAFILLFTFGIWMLIDRPATLKEGYMHIKLGFLVLLVIYHFINQRIYNRSKKNILKMSGFSLRLWNEVATLILVAVVFVVVIKTDNWVYGLLGLLLFAFAISLGVFLYRRFREKDQQEAVEQKSDQLLEEEPQVVKEDEKHAEE